MATSLTRVTSSLYTFPQLHLLLSAARNFSTRPETSLNRVGFEAESEPEPERSSLQKLEDAVHRVVVRKSQPDWLPFRPGSSYWVPPKSQSRGFAHVMTNLANSVASAADPAMEQPHQQERWKQSLNTQLSLRMMRDKLISVSTSASFQEVDTFLNVHLGKEKGKKG
ncbi:hypothetical protein V2J09_002948 [Rumex salicifolius]